MPNHVQNKLSINGDAKDVSVILDYIKSKNEDGTKSQIDFNKIIPMAKELNISFGSGGDLAYELLFDDDEFSLCVIKLKKSKFKMFSADIQRQAVDLAIKYNENIKQYGAKTWYDWAINNWGTKWNAYSQNDSRTVGNVIYFQTTWAAPVPVIEKLSGIFPIVTLILDYADEDSGYNTGQYVFQGGGTVVAMVNNGGSKEGYEKYFELNPGSRDDYEFDGTTYKFKNNNEVNDADGEIRDEIH